MKTPQDFISIFLIYVNTTIHVTLNSLLRLTILLRLSSDEHGNHLPTPQSSFVADGLLVGLFMHEGGWKAGLLTTRVFEVSHVHPRVCHGMVLLPSSHLQVWSYDMVQVVPL